VAEKKRLC